MGSVTVDHPLWSSLVLYSPVWGQWQLCHFHLRVDCWYICLSLQYQCQLKMEFLAGIPEAQSVSHGYESCLSQCPIKGWKLFLKSDTILLKMAFLASELRGLCGASFIEKDYGLDLGHSPWSAPNITELTPLGLCVCVCFSKHGFSGLMKYVQTSITTFLKVFFFFPFFYTPGNPRLSHFSQHESCFLWAFENYPQ